MAYEGFNSKAVAAMEYDWVSVREMAEFARQLGSIKFALQSERTHAVDIIGKINVVVGKRLFTRYRRFPKDEAYVSLQLGDWPGKLTQVTLAANYKPPENSFIVGNTNAKEVFRPNKPDKEPQWSDDAALLQDPTERQKFEKAMVMYFQGIRDIQDQLGNAIGVFSQSEFESHFYLRWNENPTRPNPPGTTPRNPDVIPLYRSYINNNSLAFLGKTTEGWRIYPFPTSPPEAVPKCEEWNSAYPIESDLSYQAVGDVYMTVMSTSLVTPNEIEYRTLRYNRQNGQVTIVSRGSVRCGEGGGENHESDEENIV